MTNGPPRATGSQIGSPATKINFVSFIEDSHSNKPSVSRTAKVPFETISSAFISPSYTYMNEFQLFSMGIEIFLFLLTFFAEIATIFIFVFVLAELAFVVVPEFELPVESYRSNYSKKQTFFLSDK